jgi:hypothetical protein
MTYSATMHALDHQDPRDTRRRSGDAHAPRLAADRELSFRPEEFFVGRTVGGGAVRNPFGRIVRRCYITTEGRSSAGLGSVQFQETFAYDDGELDVWRWAMTAGRDGHYVAAEESAGSGISGQHRDGDYVLEFRRPQGKAQGLIAPHFATRFTLLAPDMAMKHVRISVLGAPVATLSAVHRRVDD